MNKLSGVKLPWAKLANSPPLVRVVVFLLVVVVLWLPFALPLYGLAGRGLLPGGDLLPTALLYVVFLLVLPRWEREVRAEMQPWARIGFAGRRELGQGMATGALIGALSLALLAVVQLALGWAVLDPNGARGVSLLQTALIGALAATAVGWSEEVLFRGWLLRELEQGWSSGAALGATSLIFAIAHFIKPLDAILALLPQFAGLLLLGLVLGWARRIPVGLNKTGLGYPVGLHAGLVWGYYLLEVGNLLQPTGVVPAWVTGLDGNPLAGLLGLTLLSGLGVLVFRWSRSSH
ncbi:MULTISPECIES: CPBP family intramembrane glutamic endopeptidase [Cyanophyceae]|uniref:CPBP family intramembrane glutamic endopeptidase n=1 Tax=Cyanophyceae TaxID=3028117 RepID=UPI00168729BF|nr:MULTISPECIES: CPBP family intramembrane glutamic endopeptidase [Cyanophyceae]MBD1916024.1 CPBP family intramembrane metalloprotease [Phormidium sp. FACHB-77]MBD2031707.1 CPBP family intramembrane metalloprotease [Phormidium sp. FACHB-322]MBD2052666.1 CPBP family intramembrane metalloprotease [Leptolyngbya sp. FACHB-60]